jgi:hypothetical protein
LAAIRQPNCHMGNRQQTTSSLVHSRISPTTLSTNMVTYRRQTSRGQCIQRPAVQKRKTKRKRKRRQGQMQIRQRERPRIGSIRLLGRRRHPDTYTPTHRAPSELRRLRACRRCRRATTARHYVHPFPHICTIKRFSHPPSTRQQCLFAAYQQHIEARPQTLLLLQLSRMKPFPRGTRIPSHVQRLILLTSPKGGCIQVLQEVEAEGYCCREVYVDTFKVNFSAAAEEVAAMFQVRIVPVSSGTRQENAYAESAVRTIIAAMSRSQMAGAPHMDGSCWGLSDVYCAAIVETLPQQGHDKRSPHEIKKGWVPDPQVLFIHVFGCPVQYEPHGGALHKRGRKPEWGYFV